MAKQEKPLPELTPNEQLLLERINADPVYRKWATIEMNKYRGRYPHVDHEGHLEYHDDLRGSFYSIYDWYRFKLQQNPRFQIASFGWPKAWELSAQWHIDLDGYEKDEVVEYEPTHPELIVYQYADGWTIQQMVSEQDFKAESYHMKHCVKSYFPRVKNEECRIFSLRDLDNIPYVTIEFAPRQNKIIQIKAHRNQDPMPEYKFKLGEWFNTIQDIIFPWSRYQGYQTPSPYEARWWNDTGRFFKTLEDQFYAEIIYNAHEYNLTSLKNEKCYNPVFKKDMFLTDLLSAVIDFMDNCETADSEYMNYMMGKISRFVLNKAVDYDFYMAHLYYNRPDERVLDDRSFSAYREVRKHHSVIYTFIKDFEKIITDKHIEFMLDKNTRERIQYTLDFIHVFCKIYYFNYHYDFRQRMFAIGKLDFVELDQYQRFFIDLFKTDFPIYIPPEYNWSNSPKLIIPNLEELKAQKLGRFSLDFSTF